MSGDQEQPGAEPWLAGPPPPPPPPPGVGRADRSSGPGDGAGDGRRDGAGGGGASRPGGAASPGDGGPTRLISRAAAAGRTGRDGLAVAAVGLRRAAEAVPLRSRWLLGPAGIAAAFALSWLADIVSAFRHQPGLPAQDRVLALLGPASLTWAVAVLVGVALVACGRHFERGGAADRRGSDLVLSVLLMEGAVVAVFAGLAVLVELTDLGNGVDAALSGLVGYLAVAPIAVAAVWWAWQAREDHSGGDGA